jgi:hypothetical protein
MTRQVKLLLGVAVGVVRGHRGDGARPGELRPRGQDLAAAESTPSALPAGSVVSSRRATR